MPARRLSERVLVLAPGGRDAAVATAVLAESGLRPQVCASLAEVAALLEGGAGLVLVADEALHDADLRGIAHWVAEQPSWSDLPFVVLTRQGGSVERNPAAARLTRLLGNVAFVERPFHATTLASVAASALRGRRRQYEAREHLVQVREAEERLRLALQAGQLGAWELELAGRRLIASEQCKRDFGRAADDDFGYDDLLAAVHPDDRARMRQAVEHSVATGASYDIEHRVVWPDGTLHWLAVKARLLRDALGQASGLVGVSLDVTGQRAAEAERERLLSALSAERAALERRVAERTHDLETVNTRLLQEMADREQAEQRLRQAQKIEAIGQLVAGVAHDFNNLLMAIIGNLEVVGRRVAVDAGLSRMTTIALRAAQRGAGLTQRLLAFARRQDLQPRSIDAAALLCDLLPLIERSVGPLVQVALDAPAALPAVRVDPGQLETALLNLAVNARDAMPGGGRLTVTLDAERLAEPTDDGLAAGDYVVLAVRDSGQGMSAETLARAVEPFFTTKGVGRGTGLGLSMVHGLARQSGGAFRLRSALGEGTTAALWLPVSDRVRWRRPSPTPSPRRLAGRPTPVPSSRCPRSPAGH